MLGRYSLHVYCEIPSSCFRLCPSSLSVSLNVDKASWPRPNRTFRLTFSSTSSSELDLPFNFSHLKLPPFCLLGWKLTTKPPLFFVFVDFFCYCMRYSAEVAAAQLKRVHQTRHCSHFHLPLRTFSHKQTSSSSISPYFVRHLRYVLIEMS